MNNPRIVVSFPREHQEILIEGLKLVEARLESLAQSCASALPTRVRLEAIPQYLVFDIIAEVFDLVRGTTYALVADSTTILLQEYLAHFIGNFPSLSATEKQVEIYHNLCANEIQALATEVQDHYYVSIGEMYRNRFQTYFLTRNKKINPSPELFFGPFAPSEIFPDADVRTRGHMMPFFQGLLYHQAKRETSVARWIGDVKQVSFEDDRLQFRTAAALGFVTGPPEKTAFYQADHWIAQHLSEFDQGLNRLLASWDIHDLTVSAGDATNIPVDERDTTGSIGTGSRGSFFGHKDGTIAGANCLPITSEMDKGHVADSSLFSANFQELDALARISGKDRWAQELDAAFCLASIIDEIEAADVIPFIDLNMKNSKLLATYKQAVDALTDLSKKAVYSLTLEERQAILDHLKEYSAQATGIIPLQRKKVLLRTLLENVANEARKRGLTRQERHQEKKLRRKIMQIRQQIRKSGTSLEKKVALQAISHRTIEWFLMYRIRGQDEGLYGIIKKQDLLIGEGQHTSWLVGETILNARCQFIFTGLKCVAWIYYGITGNRQRFMCACYNWRHEQHFLFIIYIAFFVGKAPILIQ